MAAHNNYPLPPTPGQLQNNYSAAPVPEQSRSAQRRSRQKSRTFSFRSDKSQRSGGGGGYQVDAHETAAEKDANRLHSKADPTLAMNEAEPSVIQATVKSSLASLRNMDHRDAYGNAIGMLPNYPASCLLPHGPRPCCAAPRSYTLHLY
jgi:hypothetical protein